MLAQVESILISVEGGGGSSQEKKRKYLSLFTPGGVDGTGLRLDIVKKIVDGHQESIKVGCSILGGEKIHDTVSSSLTL